MKLISLKCNNCAAIMEVNSELKEINCIYCGNKMLIDDEVIKHRVENAEQIGYEMEKGKQKFKQEYEQELKKQKAKKQEERKNKIVDAKNKTVNAVANFFINLIHICGIIIYNFAVISLPLLQDIEKTVESKFLVSALALVINVVFFICIWNKENLKKGIKYLEVVCFIFSFMVDIYLFFNYLSLLR